MNRNVVISGLGVVTPLGNEAGEVMARIAAGESAAAAPKSFDVTPFDCPLCSEIEDFDAEVCFPENKTLRMMNRDAQLAVVAARRAIQDAGLIVGRDYQSDEVGLFGSTGLAGMPVGEISRLVRNSAGSDGELDLASFGQKALKRVRPVLSFKILANMPICFVSIFEGIRGPNAVYTPWEGQGARAIAAGITAIHRGRLRCALVGGCDAKTHPLGFISLQQHGVFRSWPETQSGTVPGEGASFLVLEDEESSQARGAKVYARIAGWEVRTKNGQGADGIMSETMSSLGQEVPQVIIAAGDGDDKRREAELEAIAKVGAASARIVNPKQHVGNLFSAAAAVQLCLAAEQSRTLGQGVVWANCFGHGSELGSFALEAV